jgi:hypothetical protein
MTKLKDLLTEASAKDRYNAPPMNKWWTGDKDALMAAIYHAQRQLPPTNKSDYEKNWKSIVQQLQKKFPAPTSVYKAKLNEGSKADRWFDNLKYYYEKGLKSPDLKDSEEKKAYIKLAKNFFGKLKEGKLNEANYGKPYKKGETIKTKEGTTLKVLKIKKGQDFARDEYILQYLDGKSKGQKFEMWHYMLHNLDLERHPGYKPKGKGRGIKEGFITKYNNKADMSVLSKYIQSFMDWCWETKDDALDVAGMYLDQDEPKLAKNWRAFSQSLVIIYKELKNLDAGYAARTKAVLPSALQKKLENAKFHQGPTTEDNYKQVLKQAIMFMKELKKLK